MLIRLSQSCWFHSHSRDRFRPRHRVQPWPIRYKNKTAVGHWESFQYSNKRTQARDFAHFLLLNVDSALSCGSHSESNHIDKARSIMETPTGGWRPWASESTNSGTTLLGEIRKFSLLFRLFLFRCPDNCTQNCPNITPCSFKTESQSSLGYLYPYIDYVVS